MVLAFPHVTHRSAGFMGADRSSQIGWNASGPTVLGVGTLDFVAGALDVPEGSIVEFVTSSLLTDEIAVELTEGLFTGTIPRRPFEPRFAVGFVRCFVL